MKLKADSATMASICLSVLLCGCSTTPEPQKIPDDGGVVTPLNMIAPEEPLRRLCVKDTNFDFSIDAGGLPNIEVKDSDRDRTIEDLYNFAQTACYNAKLRPKLAQGKPISRDEARLLEFVLDVDAAMVEALTQSIYVDMMDITEFPDNTAQTVLDVKMEERRKRELKVFAPLVVNYLKSKDTLRKKIKSYCSYFSRMSPGNKMAELEKISENIWSDERRKANEKDLWLWAIFGCRYFGYYETEKELTPLEKDAKNIDLENYFDRAGNEWSRLQKLMITYLRDVNRTYDDIRKYVSHESLTDSESKAMAALILKEHIDTRDVRLKDFAMYLYDFPFVLLTHRAQADYRDCKGFLNDNETKMEEALERYGEAICGARMLERVVSSYAIGLFSSYIQHVKSDIGDNAFKSVQSRTSLKEHAKRTLERDVETGLSKNELFNSDEEKKQ